MSRGRKTSPAVPNSDPSSRGEANHTFGFWVSRGIFQITAWP